LLARDGWLTSRAVPDFSSFSVVESCAGSDRRFFFGRLQRIAPRHFGEFRHAEPAQLRHYVAKIAPPRHAPALVQRRRH